MSKSVASVSKLLGVLVLFSLLYLFLFGTSDFFVQDAGGENGSYSGALASVVTSVETPMAIYYRDYTFKSNQDSMQSIESSLSTEALKIYTP